MYTDIDLDKRCLCIVSDKNQALSLIHQLNEFHLSFREETKNLEATLLDPKEDLAAMDIVIKNINFPNEIISKIYCNLFYKGYDKNSYKAPDLDTFYNFDKDKSWFLIEEMMEID